jgi:2-phospho-L-lactate transferase/gluconeogenesis factor (CofD/UPF0052 family)
MSELLTHQPNIFPGHLVMPGEDIVALGGGSGLAGTMKLMARELTGSNITTGTSGVDTGGSNGHLNALARTHHSFRKLNNPVSDFRRIVVSTAGGHPEAADRLEEVANDRIPRGVTRREFLERVAEFRTAVTENNPTVSKRRISNAVGDIRRTAEALPKGVGGHTLGSLMLAGSAGRRGIVGALEHAVELFDSRVEAMPVATGWYNLGRIDGNGMAQIGEHAIDEEPLAYPERAFTWLTPHPEAHTPLTDRIGRASVLFTKPGSHYTSILPALLPEGMSDAIRKMRANGGLWIAISNLVVNTQVDPKDSQTGEYWGAGHYVRDMGRQLGMVPDVMLYNLDTESLPAGETPMDPGLEALEDLGVLALGGQFVGQPREASVHETIVRSKVLTDGRKVAHEIYNYMPTIREFMARRSEQEADLSHPRVPAMV